MKYEANTKKVKCMCYLAFFLNGIIAVTTGSILNIMIENYGYSYNQSGFAVASQSVGNLLFCLLSGMIIHKVGKKRVLLTFSGLFVVSSAMITVSKSYEVVCVILFMSGIAWGLCNNIIHLIIVENNPNDKRSLAFLHTSYAMGSFVGPMLFSITGILLMDWRVVMWITVVASIILVIGFKSGYKQENVIETEVKHSTSNMISKKKYYLCIVLYFGYIGIEVSINAWLVIYLNGVIGIELHIAQMMLSLLWLIIIVFRVINTTVIARVRCEKVLILQWIGVTLSMLLLYLSDSILRALLAVIILAIMIAGISPTNAENAKNYISGTGLWSGILFASGGLGGVILPLMMGNTSDLLGLRSISICFLFCSIIMIVISIYNFKLEK